MPRMLVYLMLICGAAIYPGVDGTSEEGGTPDLSFGLAAVASGETFILPSDLEISLWAESPLFFNPTNIDVDARGRVWVTEGVNYRDFNNRDSHRRHQPGDRVVILEDTDADGRADTSVTFIQDADLRSPLGIATIGRRVVVSSSPSMFAYTDANGDDRPDARDTLLTGFGGYDHDHGLHSLTAGPDGLWYFNTGNAGPHVVTDGEGWTLRSGSMYTGGTPYNTENEPGLVSDDGRVWVGGLALRMRPDGTGLEVLAHNFRNAYELAVDSYGNLWQNDNDDEVMACRTTWVMEGGNHGYFSADGSRRWQADRRPGQDVFTAHWHQDDPGVVPAGDHTGAGAPSGIVVYEGDALGAKYRGMLLSADAGRNVIYAYWPEPHGAGFRLKRVDLVTPVDEPTENYVWNEMPRDTAKWFRPSDVAVGPDGAIYIADWYDPVVGGHQMHDRRGYGRIYRITPKDRRLEMPELDLDTWGGQVDALLSPAVNVRALGFESLLARGEMAIDEVADVLEDSNPYHRARAVWLLAQSGPAGEAIVRERLDDPDPQLRIAAFRALRRVSTQEEMLEIAAPLTRDASPAVRREVAIALRDVPFRRSSDLLLALAEGYDGSDRWYLEAYGIASDGKEEPVFDMLSEAFGSDPEKWDRRVAGLAWRLHPVSAVDAFTQRASSPDVPPPERRRALAALGFIDHPRAAQAMADLTRSALPDVAERASWWLQYRKMNDWYEHPVEGWARVVPDLDEGPLDRLLARRAVVLDADARIDRRLEAAQELARDPQGGRTLIELAGRDRLPYQVRQVVGAELFSNPDVAVRALASRFFLHPGGHLRYDVGEIVALNSDPERGRGLFLRSCASCHRAAGGGGEVGPDLTSIREKLDRAALADAIVHPDAAIAFGYEASILRMKDGQVLIGQLMSEGDVVELRDATGRRRAVEKADIDSRQALDVGLMPDPQTLGLDAQDVADIAAFLLDSDERR